MMESQQGDPQHESGERQTHVFGEREAPPERERIGDILRRVREQRGESLYAISDFLRIRPTFLAALENSRYDEFAADAYVTGFLKTYADYLGLDTRASVEMYRREMAGRRRKPQLNMPKPISEGRAPTVAILFGAAMAALLLYALWYWLSSSSRTQVELAPQLPRTPASEPAAASAPVRESPAEQTPAPEKEKSEPAPLPEITGKVLMTEPKPPTGISLSSALPTVPFPAGPAIKTEDKKAEIKEEEKKTEVKNAEEEKKAETEKVGEPLKLTPGAAKDQGAQTSEKARVIVKATKETWVLITDNQGNTILDKMMEPGETYVVPNGKNLRLTAGNGEGVTLSLDGVELPKLGADSHIVRDVPLDPNRVKDLRPSSGD